jgi:2-succinyl-6-hydroxy-2,4-cyclohexadiene-1-carboxylate synthase
MSVVFLHGFLSSPATWENVVHELSIDAQYTHKPWLPGHGLAPWFCGETFVDAVDAVAARLPTTPSVVVGYSLGARLALGLAARHPERVARAVLVGVNPGLREDEAREVRLAEDEARANTLEGACDLDAFVERWEKLPLFDTQKTLPPSRQDARRLERRTHTPHGIAWALRALSLGAMPCWDDLSQIAPHIDLITGARDDKFTKIARELAATDHRTRHVVVDGAGHDVVLEAPEALARVLAKLLDRSLFPSSASFIPHPEAS